MAQNFIIRNKISSVQTPNETSTRANRIVVISLSISRPQTTAPFLHESRNIFAPTHRICFASISQSSHSLSLFLRLSLLPFYFLVAARVIYLDTVALIFMCIYVTRTWYADMRREKELNAYIFYMINVYTQPHRLSPMSDSLYFSSAVRRTLYTHPTLDRRRHE